MPKNPPQLYAYKRPTFSQLMNRENYSPTLETAIRASKFFGKPIVEIWVLEE